MGCGGNIFARDISQNIMQTAEDKDEVSHHSKSATRVERVTQYSAVTILRQII